MAVASTSAEPRESRIDVLIIGAGPAGLLMASWMARCGIQTRIVDKRGTEVFNGQADALQPRSLEIFESFGMVDRILKEANLLAQACMWNPNKDGILHCSDKVPFNPYTPEVNRYYPYVLHQGRTERFLLDLIKEDNDLSVERDTLPTFLSINEADVEDPLAYPVTVKLRKLLEEDSDRSIDDEEIVHAKYVIGTDGAHSWVRNQIQCKLEGDSTDYVWGVMDIVPVTDFPDIRSFTILHSIDAGSVLMVPREKNLVRFYVQLTRTQRINEAAERLDRSKYNPQLILESAQQILRPYKLNYSQLDWWTLYQVGQRVGDRFESHNRVFLAGDAVHTHSPKAGQGMNVSLQDTYNLGWKIAHVVQGQASRSILATYEAERRALAQDLIEFDRKWAELFSGRPIKDVMDADSISIQELLQVFAQRDMFMKGLAIDYSASILVAKETSINGTNGDLKHDVNTSLAAKSHQYQLQSNQTLAPGIKVGKRLPSASLIRQSDARPSHLLELLPSNERWRVLVFTGNIKDAAQSAKVSKLADSLSSRTSFLSKYTPPGSDVDSVFEVLAIHSTPARDVSIFDFPEVFRWMDEKRGYDYGKIFANTKNEASPGVYDVLGVSSLGCVVLVRPDQYVSYLGSLDDLHALDEFFGRFMLDQHGEGNGS